MGIIENSLWVEKYRPKELSDLILGDDRRARFEEMIRAGGVPHLMLIGTPGIGKTSLAKILIAHLDCECIVFNSSMSRGIDTVRDKVINFVTMRGQHRWRIVLMEEGDNLTPDAQQALRNVMEEYSERARFIFTGNFSSKIIDPIKSRCQIFEFSALSQKECFKRLRYILDTEHIVYQPEDALRIVDTFYPDLRKMINAAQLGVVADRLTTVRIDLAENEQVFKLIKEKNLDAIRAIAYRIDCAGMYNMIFDRIGELEPDRIKQVNARLWIAEMNKTHNFSLDHELHFTACCFGIMEGKYQ